MQKITTKEEFYKVFPAVYDCIMDSPVLSDFSRADLFHLCADLSALHYAVSSEIGYRRGLEEVVSLGEE